MQLTFHRLGDRQGPRGAKNLDRRNRHWWPDGEVEAVDDVGAGTTVHGEKVAVRVASRRGSCGGAWEGAIRFDSQCSAHAATAPAATNAMPGSPIRPELPGRRASGIAEVQASQPAYVVPDSIAVSQPLEEEWPLGSC